MNKNKTMFKLANVVDGKKRKKYKSTLWSDIVDEYEADMRAEEIAQANLLEIESKKQTSKLNSIISVKKGETDEEGVISLIASTSTEKNSDKAEKSITQPENSLEKECPTSVNNEYKSEKNIICSKVSTEKIKSNADAERANQAIKNNDKKGLSKNKKDNKKLLVESIVVDKPQKASKITKNSSLDNKSLIKGNTSELNSLVSVEKEESIIKKESLLDEKSFPSLHKGQNPDENNVTLKMHGKNKDANKATTDNKIQVNNKEKDKSKTPTSILQENKSGETVIRPKQSLSTTGVSEKPVLNVTTVKLDSTKKIPKNKTEVIKSLVESVISADKQNIHSINTQENRLENISNEKMIALTVKRDESKPILIKETNRNKTMPKVANVVDGKKRKKYKSTLWSDIVDEYEADMRAEEIAQNKLLENESKKQTSELNSIISVNKGETEEERVICPIVPISTEKNSDRAGQFLQQVKLDDGTEVSKYKTNNKKSLEKILNTNEKPVEKKCSISIDISKNLENSQVKSFAVNSGTIENKCKGKNKQKCIQGLENQNLTTVVQTYKSKENEISSKPTIISTTGVSAEAVWKGSTEKLDTKNVIPKIEKGVMKSLVDSVITVDTQKRKSTTPPENSLEKACTTSVNIGCKSETNVICPKGSTPTIKSCVEAERANPTVKNNDKKMHGKNLPKNICANSKNSSLKSSNANKATTNNKIQVNNNEKDKSKMPNTSILQENKSQETVVRPKHSLPTIGVSEKPVLSVTTVKLDCTEKIHENKKEVIKSLIESVISVDQQKIHSIKPQENRLENISNKAMIVPTEKRGETKLVPKKETIVKTSLVDAIIHIVKPKKSIITPKSSVQNLLPTFWLQANKANETVIRAKDPTPKTDISVETACKVPTVKLDSTNVIPKIEKGVMKSLVETVIPVDTPKRKSITSPENSLEKECPTSVNNVYKSEKNVICAKVSTTKIKSNVDAERANPTVKNNDKKGLSKNEKDYKKLSVESIVVDKPKKASKITQNSSLDNKSLIKEHTPEFNSLISVEKEKPIIKKENLLDEESFPSLHKGKKPDNNNVILKMQGKNSPKKLCDNFTHSPLKSSDGNKATTDSKIQVNNNEIDKSKMPTSILQENKSEETVVCPKHSMSTIGVGEKPVLSFTIVKLDSKKKIPKNKKEVIKSLVEPVISVDKQKIHSINTQENRFENISNETMIVPTLKRGETKLVPKKETIVKTSLVDAIIHIVKPKKSIITPKRSVQSLLPTFWLQAKKADEKVISPKDPSLTTDISVETACKGPTVKLDSTNVIPNIEKGVIKSLVETVIPVDTQKINLINTQENISNEAKKVPKVKCGESKLVPKKEWKRKKTMDSSIKENNIQKYDNNEDINMMTRKSGAVRLKFTKISDDNDKNNNISIEAPIQRNQNYVDKLCHKPVSFTKDLNTKVLTKKSPDHSAKPFASVYKNNNGAITFLNQALDDEFLSSPDFERVFISCFPSS